MSRKYAINPNEFNQYKSIQKYRLKIFRFLFQMSARHRNIINAFHHVLGDMAGFTRPPGCSLKGSFLVGRSSQWCPLPILRRGSPRPQWSHPRWSTPRRCPELRSHTWLGISVPDKWQHTHRDNFTILNTTATSLCIRPLLIRLLDNSWIRQLADWTTCGLVNSRTRQLAYWAHFTVLDSFLYCVLLCVVCMIA